MPAVPQILTNRNETSFLMTKPIEKAGILWLVFLSPEPFLPSSFWL